MYIKNKRIGKNFKSFLIAEVGLSHEGSMGLAFSMIDRVKKVGADAVKFQMHIAEEETKFGLDDNELYEILEQVKLNKFENVKIIGLMGMATFTENQTQIKKEFLHLKSIFDKLNTLPTTNNYQPTTLSMGMSGDYKLAIECGSTMVRIGSSIFGGRK